MNIAMYDASVSVFTRTLTSLRGILEKTQQHAEARKIDPAALLQARLFPDMFTFTKQVQIATDFANSAAARLGGKEPPSMPDTEASFADLIARVDRTLEHLRSVKRQDIDGSEAREIVRPMRGQPHKFTGVGFLLQYVLPNFFFHATTAYAILRHNGVELGKQDFIGAID